MPLGLRAKLTLAIALLIVVFAGFLLWYLPAGQAEVARENLHTRAKSTSLALSAAVEPLLSHDPERLNDVFLAQFAMRSGLDSDQAYIVVVKRNTATPASYRAPKMPPDVETVKELIEEARTIERDGYIHTSVPILSLDGQPEGTLTTGLSQQAVDDARNSSLARSLVLSVVILVFGVALAWLVGGQIATPILAAARELDNVSSNLVEAARDQEASSAQEAAAVAETRRSMETLLNSAQQIADRSSQVLGNAERSANGSREIAGRIGNLNELSEKVTDLLATIMQVADKADLLALNASLEGTRAGDAGKGFALVASEMRRLAENIVESVVVIRDLMKNMREASQAAVLASEEGTKSSTETTQSARQIALLTQDQRQATEQVIASMDEMGDILNHTLDGIQRTTTTARQLEQLAGDLSHIVNPATASERVRHEESDD
ncbi:MAG: methyl-accepting chemotaxis protein [Proteobacteria bacterium]|nr:methyl-accepting chemotaxis protein [Pseudomonadota bacterium]